MIHNSYNAKFEQQDHSFFIIVGTQILLILKLVTEQQYKTFPEIPLNEYDNRITTLFKMGR